jgi:hypothetical protein
MLFMPSGSSLHLAILFLFSSIFETMTLTMRLAATAMRALGAVATLI